MTTVYSIGVEYITNPEDENEEPKILVFNSAFDLEPVVTFNKEEFFEFEYTTFDNKLAFPSKDIALEFANRFYEFIEAGIKEASIKHYSLKIIPVIMQIGEPIGFSLQNI